eukprot:g16458.t1
MMNAGKTASRVGRVVLAQASKNAALSTRAAAPARFAVANLPMKQLPIAHVGARSFFSSGPSAEEKSVMAAVENWRDTLTSGADDAPTKVAALYAPDALFWGTVSEQVRTNPTHVLEYFEYFARSPKLTMTRLNPGKVQIHGDIAIQAGDYTFTWVGADGPVEVDARFTFHFRKEADGWKIVEHHSSAMPTAPPALKPAL